MATNRAATGANRRTRQEPPTLEEAIFAAQGLGRTPDEQAAIAAMLMGVPEAEVRPHVPQVAAGARPMRERMPGRPAVIVERRGARLPRR
jgi:hypothetical protein